MRRTLLVLTALLAYAPAAHAQLTSSALLDTVQHTAFQFFWSEANPANGLIRDRSQSGSAASIASMGFGLSAICVGVDHGWITRAQGRDRVRTTLETLWAGPQGSASSGTIGYRGFFYHFLDMSTATRTWDCELSSIDTALLFAGVIDARQYFDGADTTESRIRFLADTLVHRADWNFMRNFNPGVLMGWKPGTGFSGYGQWIGYNEAMILYLLALGSPYHGVPASAWTQWTSGYSWGTLYGQTYVSFPPLFGHQYSHCWVDFRGTADAYMQAKGITYFENSRRATLAQRAYCAANPGGFTGYSDSLWGLTACDGPYGYNARGAPPAQNDDGTLAPTAPISSIPFTPDESQAALRNLWNTYRAQLWGPYGFRDAFNLSLNWWDTDYIGIDQGPIVLMIENHRTGKVWQRFMQNADIQLGMQRAGFLPFSDAVPPGGAPGWLALEPAAPNPFRGTTTIRFRLAREARVRLTVYDVGGREVARLLDGVRPAGSHAVALRGDRLPSGVYLYQLESEGTALRRRCVLLR